MKITATHILLMIVLSAQILCGQECIVRQQDSLHMYPANSRVVSVITDGKIVSTSVGSGNDIVRYIIEVASASGTQVMSKSGSGIDAVGRSAVRRQLDAIPSTVQTLHEYSSAMNGFCVQTRRKNLALLRNLPGVLRVSEDLEVRCTPIAAAASAPSTVSPLAGRATGKGIRVGVIDTGIDFLHEAFGGGYGPGFKVCGGYNFITPSALPMDDNKHGTHVAGIIAGNSRTFSGMAVNASLYSYKALKADGAGYTGTVIAAIDRAIADSMKVINLSLGSSNGDPDDILSRAVDRAAAAGIVVVVAAGNDSEPGSIGSPGAARMALTVGAVDSNNVIAPFSSKGPTQKNFGIKPDVVAPGVGIMSVQMGGGYMALSGTSMAAPYVAGVAAGLAELHPSWSGEQIRDAIIQSSTSLAYPVFTAGSGRVDPVKAAGMQTIAVPGSLSLGFNTTTDASWMMQETVYVVNTRGTAQTFTLAGSASSPAISIRFHEPSLAAAPNQRAAVVAEILVTNGALADNLSLFTGYTGTITASSALDTVSIPFAFFKGKILQIIYDETPWQVIVHNRKSAQYSFQPKKNSITTVLPADTYDIMTTFSTPHYVVRESVQLSDVATVLIDKSEAKHPIRLLPIDETGKAVAAGGDHELYSSIDGIVHRASGISMVAMGGGAYDAVQAASSIYCSDLSPRYIFGSTLNIQQGTDSTFTYDAAIETGIADTVIFTFSPGEGVPLDVRYDVDTMNTRTMFPIVWSSIALQGVIVSNSVYDGTSPALRFPFSQRSLYFKRSSSFFPVFHSREGYTY
jgi:subtilisin family serine protease